MAGQTDRRTEGADEDISQQMGKKNYLHFKKSVNKSAQSKQAGICDK